MKLSTAPYKGARDFYPEDKLKQNYMFGVLRSVVKSYGYEEYDAPILEALELYKAKSGEEIVSQQTYNFTDRGGREVAIRPEMTPTVSRMVAARRQELVYPLRWFSAPNLWRYERPQKGRLREHWQLNVDLFGVSGQLAETELIMIADSIFKAFKANREMYHIKLNHRGLMDYLFANYLKLDSKQAYATAKLIDRKAKMPISDFLSQLDSLLSPEQKKRGLAEKLLTVLEAKSLKDLPIELRNSEPAQEIAQLLSDVSEVGLDNVVFDPTLMRGFDYYNGLVFELYDNHPDNNRSLMGGGRYDGLVGLFGVQPVPTVGFGLGDATLANFLELHGLMPDLKPETDIYLAIVLNEDNGGLKTATKLRSAGLNVAVDFVHKKLGDQLKTAQKKNIRYVVIVGSEELKSNQFTLRDLQESSERKLSIEQIASLLKAK